MSHRGPLTTVLTTVLGAALGGLLIWQVYRAKRKKPSSVQKPADPVALPCPVENVAEAAERQQIQLPPVADKEFKTAECQTTRAPPPVRIPSCHQLLTVKAVMVSSSEDWQEMWPLMQKELSVFPVLGLDCEWVKAEGVRNTFCITEEGKENPP